MLRFISLFALGRIGILMSDGEQDIQEITSLKFWPLAEEKKSIYQGEHCSLSYLSHACVQAYSCVI